MLLHWIWFAEIKEITLLHKHRLLEHFRDPEELYNTSDKALLNLGIPEKYVQALQKRDLLSAREILKKCARRGISVLPVGDVAFPPKLRNTPDAPVLLYYKGILPDWDSAPFIGIVGTRKASSYGLQVAYQMGSQIAVAGGYVVSGGADGADTAAMMGALDNGYPVVGVLGCGVDVVYPYKNRKLFERTVKDGCLLSEYPPGEKALPWHFPERNRIISGLSNGVLVVEAPKKSGALITARRALEQGRDVFVVPGNINTETCEGSNALLQEGAMPVFSGWDVLNDYAFLYPGKLQKPQPAFGEQTPGKVAQKPVIPENLPQQRERGRKISIDNGEDCNYIELDKKLPALSNDEQAVLACLSRDAQEPAELIAKLDMPSGKVLSALTVLTVKGFVRKHPGGRISLK